MCRICFRELAYEGQIPVLPRQAGRRFYEEGGHYKMVMTDPIADFNKNS